MTPPSQPLQEPKKRLLSLDTWAVLLALAAALLVLSGVLTHVPWYTYVFISPPPVHLTRLVSHSLTKAPHQPHRITFLEKRYRGVGLSQVPKSGNRSENWT